MFVRMKQPGLYFIAGSLAQRRINSKYLALQIKACERGLIWSCPGRRAVVPLCGTPYPRRQTSSEGMPQPPRR